MLRRRQLLRGSAGLLSLAACGDDRAPQPAPPEVALSKEPYVQLVGPRSARLRFETRLEEAIAVGLDRGGERIDLEPTLSAAEVTYARDFLEESDDFFPDRPGLHVIQEVTVEDLMPGERISWEVRAPEPRSGSFVAPPATDVPVRLGWLSDTSWPFSEPAMGTLAELEPDLVVHGGDLQYQSSPLDTWRGMSQAMAPLTSRAATHMIVGNHEFEDGNEIEQMYDRLYGGQGGTTSRYFSLRFGGLAVICLDSESGGLGEAGDPQMSWLDEQLAAASGAADVSQIVVALHRPVYTLSKHVPSSTTVRDALHQRLLDHGVRLVLQGHAHCYEHFEVDGIHYVVDGGGGAALYDPDEGIEEAESLRPGEPDLRLASARSRGVSLVELDAAGALSLSRYDEEGGSTDAFTIG